MAKEWSQAFVSIRGSLAAPKYPFERIGVLLLTSN